MSRSARARDLTTLEIGGSVKANFNDLKRLELAVTRLPFDFSDLKIEAGCRPIGFRYSKSILNIMANFEGKQIIATGEGDSIEAASAKVFSEFVERLALLSSAHKYAARNSNGWAAHPEKDQVRLNAIFELIERDAVLSQWFSSTAFLELDERHWPADIKLWAQNELANSEYPRLRILISTKGIGPSVTCLLMNKEGFGVSAHASKASLYDAICSAIAEACRPAHASIRREHWKNTLKLKSGDGDIAAPDAHAVFYAYHEPFPSWMFGEHISWELSQKLWFQNMPLLTDDGPFKYTQVLDVPLNVGFAKHPSAFELQWGSTDAELIAKQAGSKRMALEPRKINTEVHIVS